MAETVAVIDYGSGNLRSAAKALQRAADEASLRSRIEVTADPNAVRAADRIVLPGVGAFADCMAGLTGIPGMRDALEDRVIDQQRPFLGICVGMQLMAEWGVEFGRHAGLGWLKGEVTRLEPSDPTLKIPHMGWNAVTPVRAHPLLPPLAGGDRPASAGQRGASDGKSPLRPFGAPPPHKGGGGKDGTGDDQFVYFVHSYTFRPADPADLIATCDYGGAFAAMVGRGNMAGVQFHPEKSQAAGLALLARFLTWRPGSDLG